MVKNGSKKPLKVFSLSDKVIDFIYSRQVIERFQDVDLVLGCGDLPYYYLEYLVDMLKAPVLFVRGNHENRVEYGIHGNRTAPLGAIDLHRRVVMKEGLILAGVEGSLRYKDGPFMYSQSGMWRNVLSLVPNLLVNKLVHGRYLDVFVTHATPWGIHDKQDYAHQGIKAFRWFLEVFRPAYHFHGHVHIYDNSAQRVTKFEDTQVINTYGYKITELSPR